MNAIFLGKPTTDVLISAYQELDPAASGDLDRQAACYALATVLHEHSESIGPADAAGGETWGDMAEYHLGILGNVLG